MIIGLKYHCFIKISIWENPVMSRIIYLEVIIHNYSHARPRAKHMITIVGTVFFSLSEWFVFSITGLFMLFIIALFSLYLACSLSGLFSLWLACCLYYWPLYVLYDWIVFCITGLFSGWVAFSLHDWLVLSLSGFFSLWLAYAPYDVYCLLCDWIVLSVTSLLRRPAPSL